MRRTLIPGLVLAVALAGLATPAHADPSDDPQLTDNALYTSGPIARSSCAEKPIKRRNHYPTAKAYVTFVIGCLDRVWSKQLAKAGVKYRKPKVSLLSKDPARFCGYKWPKSSFSDYCESSRTLVLVLDKTLLNLQPWDLYIFNHVASLYGTHVQVLTGIDDAMREAIPESGEPGFAESLTELGRRTYLQTFCLSGVFTGSVYKSMPRKAADWKEVVRQMGKEANDFYGSAKSIAYWMNRGFNSRDPKFCNTWTASNAQVA
uniref:neutral zinc metallopeptidase n=1 Tax=Herbidospora sakaeratensis TaxID=564415 RepID=UPI000782C997|nr:neutral zinc metallopeptidase [Herbidospora sakaeratensis]